MPKCAKLAGLIAIPVLCCLLAPSANAQSEDVMGGEQMRQFAPMLKMMKQRLGKRRFGQLMRTVGPMMANMQEGGGQGMGNITGVLGSGGVGGLAGFGMGDGRRHR
jgi:hypothetical protein